MSRQPWRAALPCVLAMVLLALPWPADAAGPSVRQTIVTHVGVGAARLTLYSDGSGRVYVNLRELTPGTWKEELWTGSCAAPGNRLAALRGLIVPATGRIARTDALTAAQAKARTLRVRRGTTVLCSTFSTNQARVAEPLQYYVADSGSDSNPGTSASPWRTLQKAVDTVPQGATINVLSGTYPGFAMRRSGSPAAPILIRGTGASRPRIVGGGQSTVIDVNGVHDVTLTGLDVSNAAGPRERGAGIRVQGGSHDIRITNSVIHDNVTQGINISDGVRITVRGNDVSGNEIGIQVTRGGEGVQIVENAVHENNQMVVNTQSPSDDDYGGVGISLVGSTGRVTVTGNRLWANRARSFDYGWDGGAFEIFGASNATFTENVTWDNENILETGTNGPPCSTNVFARNISYGAATAGRTLGIFLRCAHDMRLVNNTIADLGSWAFSVMGEDRWTGSIDGLEIVNNIVLMDRGKVYGFEVPLPAGAVVGHNLVFNASGGEIATVVGHGSTKSTAVLRNWLGQPDEDLSADPHFVDRAGRDYRLSSGSPAIDRGVVVPGITEDYDGAAPDIGRFEFFTPSR